MSSQKGNVARARSQKHKNIRAFRNDMHDTSHITKKINNLEFYGVCSRCKEKIDWKVKYKKYKPLTTAKKCVKCLEKKVKMAYYIVCEDCCTKLKVCSKCAQSSDDLEYGESELERKRKEAEFQLELKQLSERQRRKFLRMLEKGELTKENLVNDSEAFKRDNADDDEDDDDDDDEEEDLDDVDEEGKKDLNNNEENSEEDDEEEDDDDDYEDFEDDQDEDEDEDEEKIKNKK